MLVTAQGNRLLERPGAIRIKGNARLGKPLGQSGHRFYLARTVEHAALELEVIEAITRLGSLGQTDNRLRRHRLFVTQAEPASSASASLR